jgi:hypothetical protein
MLVVVTVPAVFPAEMVTVGHGSVDAAQSR